MLLSFQSQHSLSQEKYQNFANSPRQQINHGKVNRVEIKNDRRNSGGTLRQKEKRRKRRRRKREEREREKKREKEKKRGKKGLKKREKERKKKRGKREKIKKYVQGQSLSIFIQFSILNSKMIHDIP